MKKFLVLYHSSTSAAEQMADATPEQAKAGMDAWMSWAGEAGAAIVDMGAPLGDSVMLSGDTPDGYIGGFSIVEAESLEAAADLFDAHPHFQMPDGAIQILEMLAMPGM